MCEGNFSPCTFQFCLFRNNSLVLFIPYSTLKHEEILNAEEFLDLAVFF